MEEDIKILEEFIKENYAINNIYPGSLKLISAIQNLINGYRKLEENSKYLKMCAMGADPLMRVLKKGYIEKSKIIKFIEETKWDLSETEYHFSSTVVDADELLKLLKEGGE